MHRVFNTELYLKTPTRFDVSMHHHHQAVVPLHRSHTPVNMQPISSYSWSVTNMSLPNGNTVDVTEPPCCMFL